MVEASTALDTHRRAEVEHATDKSKHLGEARRILVCDGEQRTALAVVRALGKHGHRVAVCSHEIPCLAGKSRYTAQTFAVPNVRLGVESYVAALRMAATAWAADIVLPLTDQSNLAVLGRRALFAPAVIPGPTLEAFIAISDKGLVIDRARALGIPTPEQVLVPAPDANDARLDAMQGPFAIKSSNVLQAGRRFKVLYAQDSRDLRKQLRDAPKDSFPLLVQRRIVGPGVGVFLLIAGGRPIATFAHERVREQPPSGGASVYCRSAAVPPALIDSAMRLLEAHDWEGVAMVEFKRERTTGIHYLMEVNGRLWGSLQLAIDAGVDFPSMMVEVASGRMPAPVMTYPVGITLRILLSDIYNTLVRLRHSPAELDLPPGSPGKLTALLDFLSISRRERLEIARFDDLKPFMFEAARRVKARFH